MFSVSRPAASRPAGFSGHLFVFPRACISFEIPVSEFYFKRQLSTGDFVLAFGLNRISLVRASGESFGRLVFDVLEATRDACFLGELFCRRLMLTDLAAPPCAPTRAARGMFGVRIDKLPDMLCMKRVYRIQKASVHWPVAWNKERFSSC